MAVAVGTDAANIRRIGEKPLYAKEKYFMALFGRICRLAVREIFYFGRIVVIATIYFIPCNRFCMLQCGWDNAGKIEYNRSDTCR